MARGRWCRTKIGQAFFIIIMVASAVFITNLVYGLFANEKHSSDVVVMEAGGASSGVRLGHHGRRRKGHRRFKNNDLVQVCRHSPLTLANDANKDAFHELPPLKCEGTSLLYLENEVVHVDNNKLKGLKLDRCEYRAVTRSSDSFHTYSRVHSRTEHFSLKIMHDFFRVQCYLDEASRQKVAESVGHRVRDLKAIEYRGRVVDEDRGLDRIADREKDSKDNPQNEKVEHQRLKKTDLREALKNERKSVLEKREKDKKVGFDNSKNDRQDEEIEHRNRLRAGEIEDKLEADKKVGDEKIDTLEKVEKEASDDTPDFDQFFVQAHAQPEVFSRIADIRNKKDGKKSEKQMNVLIFILDSMSHLSYQRKLPKTYALLKHKLKSVIMNEFNVVGDGTTANMVPLVTGNLLEELPETRRGNRENTNYVDSYPLIWYKYEQRGYATLYAEDEPKLGTFNLRLNGFEAQPTDHYMRPFWQAVWDSSLNDNSKKFCLGAKPKHQYMLDYATNFFDNYKNVSKFAVVFPGELTHDDNDPGQYIDDDLVKFVQRLHQGHHLKDTLLVVMSDHGARYGKMRDTTQGKLEERLPFLSLTFPSWFQKKFPNQIKTLRKNAERLSTPFDVHETLLDVLDNDRIMYPKINFKQRGISLLQPVPLNRTCQSAGVPMHWCTCMIGEAVNTSEDVVTMATQTAVRYINDYISTNKMTEKCAEITVDSILNARQLAPIEQVLDLLERKGRKINYSKIANFTERVKLDSVYYQVTFQTNPNKAWYEATVKHTKSTGIYTVLPEISRINSYGDQSHCVIKDAPDLREFCHCRDRPAKTTRSVGYH